MGTNRPSHLHPRSRFANSRIECLWLSPSVARNGHNRKLFSSPAERMREGAHQSHVVMVAATSKKVLRAVERLRAKGKKPTATRVARATKGDLPVSFLKSFDQRRQRKSNV